MVTTVAHPAWLSVLFGVWVGGFAVLTVHWGRRAPAASLAAVGAILGAIGGVAAGNVDGPAGVPAAAAVGATLGVIANGVAGAVLTRPTRPAVALRRWGTWWLVGTPIATAVFTFALRSACPLYVAGRGTTFCNYRADDLLGGWSSGVIFLFAVDLIVVGVLLLVSARQRDSIERASEDPWA